MATEINMVEGDTGPDRQFTVTRSGVVVDLTNATVKLVIVDTSTGNVTNANHQTCTKTGNGSTGIITYSFLSGDIASANVHFGDIVVTYTGGQIETDFDRVIIHVRPKSTTVS